MKKFLKFFAQKKIHFYQQQPAHLHQKKGDHSPPCKLQWRQGQLLVRHSQDVKQLYLPSLESHQRIVQCLKHSPVRLVRIDTTLGEAVLKQWANACDQAKKPVFLRGTVAQKWSGRSSKVSWFVKAINSITALLLLMLLSPIMLAIAVLQMYLYSPRAIFSHQWCVGTRGKLFKALRFRTTEVERNSRTASLGDWISKFNIDKLPQLFNILRGEMSLLGPRPLNLSDAVRICPDEQKYLQTLPGNSLADGIVAQV